MLTFKEWNQLIKQWGNDLATLGRKSAKFQKNKQFGAPMNNYNQLLMMQNSPMNYPIWNYNLGMHPWPVYNYWGVQPWPGANYWMYY